MRRLLLRIDALLDELDRVDIDSRDEWARPIIGNLEQMFFSIVNVTAAERRVGLLVDKRQHVLCPPTDP